MQVLLLCLMKENIGLIVKLVQDGREYKKNILFIKIKTITSSPTISLNNYSCKMCSVSMCVNVLSVSLCLSTKVCFTNLSTVTIWERAYNF